MGDPMVDIEWVIQIYLDGIYEGDIEKLASVFHPQGLLACRQDNGLKHITLKEWFSSLAQIRSSKVRGLSRFDEILQIEKDNDNMAFVRLKSEVGPHHYTDYLNFLKIDGRWLIVQKVFSVVRKGV